MHVKGKWCGKLNAASVDWMNLESWLPMTKFCHQIRKFHSVQYAFYFITWISKESSLMGSSYNSTNFPEWFTFLVNKDHLKRKQKKTPMNMANHTETKVTHQFKQS